MKRDMELIRDILVAIEECDDPHGPGRLESPHHNPSVVTYHIGLLVDAGYVRATDASTHQGHTFLVKGLTMQGHDLAASLQDPDVWSETKAKLGDRFGRAALEVVAAAAVAVAKDQIKRITGLDL